MRSILLVTSAVTALVVLTGCGNSGVKSAATADEAVKSAYDHTAAAKTAKVTVSATAAGSPDVTGTGVVNFVANTAELELKVPNAGTVQVRQIGSVVFEQGGAGAGGSRWVKSDATALIDDAAGRVTEQGQPSPEVILLALAASPTSTVAFFKGTVEGVGYRGPASVRGIATTHYFASVDLTKAAGAAGPPPSDSFSWLVDARGGRPFLGVDVWLDRAGKVRQERFTLPKLASPHSTPFVVKQGFTVTEQFSDFGTPAQVTAPPAAQTVPLRQVTTPTPSTPAVSSPTGSAS